MWQFTLPDGGDSIMPQLKMLRRQQTPVAREQELKVCELQLVKSTEQTQTRFGDSLVMHQLSLRIMGEDYDVIGYWRDALAGYKAEIHVIDGRVSHIDVYYDVPPLR